MKRKTMLKKVKNLKKEIDIQNSELHNRDSIRDKWSLNLLTSLQTNSDENEQRIRKSKK